MILEEEFISLSALQHYAFCPRQWALIYVEGIWEENSLTAEGRLLHKKAHKEIEEWGLEGKKVFGLEVSSLKFGIYGKCDVVIFGENNKCVPVEYKRGKPKSIDADKVQLCGQVFCLEEMMNINISYGFLFYFAIRRREYVAFDEALREKTLATIDSIRQELTIFKTPPPKYGKYCLACSLIDVCLPKCLGKTKRVSKYLEIESLIGGKEGKDEENS